jgi:hypothetical protein
MCCVPLSRTSTDGAGDADAVGDSDIVGLAEGVGDCVGVHAAFSTTPQVP